MISPRELIAAYSYGYFPMAHPEEGGQIYWHKPHNRGIIPLDNFHCGKNLRRLYRKGVFELRINSDFYAVIRSCAERSETWISEEIIELYIALHEMGFAHSFEAWKDDQLVGGLYGVALKGAFFGESMFHRVTDASKIALVFLVNTLKEKGFVLLDAQFITEHLKQFGAIEVREAEYSDLLQNALLMDPLPIES
jgi:leucyl/phenylalanyl-tRNA--protein transferase